MVRGSMERGRLAVLAQNGNAYAGAYGKNPDFASLETFCPWLEQPVDLDTAMKDWK